MQFVHIFVLLGILTVSVPVIIHLLNRKNARRIEWGAMMFLNAAMNKRKRSMIIEEMILLACRCLLPLMAALALSRPFVTADSQVPWVLVLPAMILAAILFGIRFALWRYPKYSRLCLLLSLLLAAFSICSIVFERQFNLKRFGGGSRKDVVLVIDGSSSMAMIGQDGKSNFERAIEEAFAYIDESPRGTCFSLILGGPVPELLIPVPISDRRILQDQLQQLKPTEGVMNATAALTSATIALSSGSNPVRQIIVLGDGQAVGWGLDAKSRWESIRKLISQLSTKPIVVWRTFPLPASVRNIAVSDVTLSRNPVGTDREVAIRVTVQNSGTESVTPESVTVRVEGKVLTDSNTRQLEPGASQVFEFRHRFTHPGSALVSATVAAQDDMPPDDEFRYVVPVLDTLKVLIVDGDSTLPQRSRAATYLSLALRPELQSSKKNDFLLETAVQDVSQFAITAEQNQLSEYAAVILCNVPKLPGKSLENLARHIWQGGGLFFLPGAKTLPDTFNPWTYQNEKVLPLSLASWETHLPGAENLPHIDTSSFIHDALSALRNSIDLRGVSPLQYWKLSAEDTNGLSFRAAALSDGEALFALKTFGQGMVALSAVPFDAVSSELPGRISFVPLVHEIIYALSRPVSPQLNLMPADGAELRVARGSEELVKNVVKRDKKNIRDHEIPPTWKQIVDISTPRETIHGELTYAADGTILTIARTLTPGLYTVRYPDPKVGFPRFFKSVLNQDGNIIINVNAGSEEGKITAVAPDEINRLREFIDISEATRKEDVIKLLNGNSFGSELWRIFAFFLLLLLIAEIAISRWISIRRRAGEQIDVDFTNEGELGKASFKDALNELRGNS